MSNDVIRDELHSAIEARKELGDEMEPAVIDAFGGRIERRLGDRADESERALQRKREHQKEMVLGSMGIAVPLLAITALRPAAPPVKSGGPGGTPACSLAERTRGRQGSHRAPDL